MYEFLQKDKLPKGKTSLEKYAARPNYEEDVSLFEFTKTIQIVKGVYKKRTKEPIVQIFPKVNLLGWFFTFYFPWLHDKITCLI